MNKWVRRILLVVFSLLFAVSAFMLIRYGINAIRNRRKYEDYSHMVDDGTEQTADPDSTDPTEETAPVMVTMTDPQGASFQMLKKYAPLYRINSDFVGWVRMPNSVIDYPVTQSPYEDNYYLHRDFEKTDSAYGCIYACEACDVQKPSDNVILYGHHMKDGTMFASLDKFRSKDYYADHKTVYFDTLTEQGTYEVFAAFVVTATEEDPYAARLFVDARDEKDFDEYILSCRKRSSVKSDLEVKYGDKILTMITCDYTRENGRMVVMAKRISVK